MRNVLLLTVNTLKVTFRKKSNILVFLVLPIIGVLLSMAMYSGSGSQRVSIGVHDMDGSILSRDMADIIDKTGNYRVVKVRQPDINNLLLDEKLECVLVIPKGFSEGVYKKIPRNIEIISVKGQAVTAWMESYVNLYVKNLLDMSEASGGSRDTFDRMYGNYLKQKLVMTVEKLEDRKNNKFVTVQSLGFLIMFILLGTFMTSEMILKEKRNRTYYRICSAPVNSRAYIFGNSLSNFTVVTVQIILLMLVMNYILRVNTYVPGYQLVIILLCFGIVAIGLNMVIVAFSSSSYQAGTLSTLVITPTCMLGGCFWPLDFMPEVMKKISYFMPQRWAIDAIQKIQTGGAFGDVFINLVILLAFAAAFFLVAAYRFGIDDKVKRFV